MLKGLGYKIGQCEKIGWDWIAQSIRDCFRSNYRAKMYACFLGITIGLRVQVVVSMQ